MQVTTVDPDKVETLKEHKKECFTFRTDIKWINVITMTLFHVIAIYGFLTFPYIQKWKSFLWAYSLTLVAAFGIAAGTHRYWCHKSYKANTPLKIILTICYLSTGLNSIYNWVRDHRIHHKFSETDADPHNSNRGFFFSHIGWLMLKKCPEVIKKGQQVDMSDIEADPVAAFSERHFTLLKIIFTAVIPIMIPVIFWNEEWYYAILSQITRYVYVFNCACSVNSFAHFFGSKPYDKNIRPVESAFVSFLTHGEGWHNYHHTIPMDYRAAELGGGRYNMNTYLIDLFAKIGWAYDCKVPSEELVKMIIAKRGDGINVNLHKFE